MQTFRTSTDVAADRRVVINLPPDTPLGKTELVVMVVPQEKSEQEKTTNQSAGSVRQFMGAVNSGDPHSADNERIDADLARAYEATNDD